MSPGWTAQSSYKTFKWSNPEQTLAMEEVVYSPDLIVVVTKWQIMLFCLTTAKKVTGRRCDSLISLRGAVLAHWQRQCSPPCGSGTRGAGRGGVSEHEQGTSHVGDESCRG